MSELILPPLRTLFTWRAEEMSTREDELTLVEFSRWAELVDPYSEEQRTNPADVITRVFDKPILTDDPYIERVTEDEDFRVVSQHFDPPAHMLATAYRRTARQLLEKVSPLLTVTTGEPVDRIEAAYLDHLSARNCEVGAAREAQHGHLLVLSIAQTESGGWQPIEAESLLEANEWINAQGTRLVTTDTYQATT